MYCRVVTGKLIHESIDKVIKVIEESTIPGLKEKKGWIDFELLFDNKTNEFIVLARWASKEDAIAVTKDGFEQEQIGKIAHLVSEKPTINVIEQFRYYSK